MFYAFITVIPAFQTCNNIEECDDGSDERAGCLLFASSPESDGCLSWFGQPHVRCRAANDSLGTPTLSMCTLPQYADSNCRQCGDLAHWRCDNGFCIPVSKVQDGIKDCKDGSDEFNCEFATSTNENNRPWSVQFMFLLQISSSGG